MTLCDCPSMYKPHEFFVPVRLGKLSPIGHGSFSKLFENSSLHLIFGVFLMFDIGILECVCRHNPLVTVVEGIRSHDEVFTNHIGGHEEGLLTLVKFLHNSAHL